MALVRRLMAAAIVVGALSSAAMADPGVPLVPGDRRHAEISSETDRDVFVVDGITGGSMTVVVRTRSGDLVPRIDVFPRGVDITQDDPEPEPVRSVTGDALGARLKRYAFDGTGPFVFAVSGVEGTTGTYDVRVMSRRPPALQDTILLANGAVRDVFFQGFGGGSVALSVVVESGASIPRPLLVNPNGVVLNEASGGILRRDRSYQGMRIPLPPGPSGSYRLRLFGPTSGGPSSVSVKIRPNYSTVRRTRVAIPVAEPVIGTVAPSIVAAGDEVTVTGSNFSPRVRVSLHRSSEADLPAVVLEVAEDGTSLRFLVPKVDGIGDPVSGLYSLIVSNPEGQFAFQNEAIGVDSGQTGSGGVSPNTGPVTGGTLVTVTGEGFLSGITIRLRDEGAPALSGTVVAVQFVSSTTVRFTTPAHAAGSIDVVLQNPGSKAVSRNSAFTYTDVSESRFFENETASVMPFFSQSGDRFAATRGAILDLDLDGRNDLVLQSVSLLPAGASLRILHQRLDGTLADDTHRSIPDRYGGFATAPDLGEGPGLAVGDIDGDSFPDVVCASTGFVPRTGATSFGYLVGPAVVENFYSEACGSVGDLPITWNDHYSATRVLRNDGNGNFFSSPFATSSIRRVPRVGFYVEAADAANAYIRSLGATVSTTTTTFQNLAADSTTGDAFNQAGAGQIKTANSIDAGVPNSGVVRIFNSATEVFDPYNYSNIVSRDGGTRNAFVLAGGVALARTYEGASRIENDVTTTASTNDPGFVDFGTAGGERFEGDTVALGDLDGNGSQDLIVGVDIAIRGVYCQLFQRGGGLNPFEAFVATARPSTRVLLNGAGGTQGRFTESAFPLFDPSLFAFPDTGYNDRGQTVDVAVGDVNGDGRNDIVMVSDRRFTFTHNRPGNSVTEYRPGTRIFLNAGSGRFNDATRSNLPVVDVGPIGTPSDTPDFYAAARVLLGDVDLDGDLDLLLATPTGIHIDAGRPWTRVLINRNGPDGPTGIFDDETDARLPAVLGGGENWQARSMALQDLNNDGAPDLILTTTHASVLALGPGTRVLMNDGTGVFRFNPPPFAPDTFIPPVGPGEDWRGDLVLVGDVDGNGKADIVISEESPADQNATRVLLRK